MSERRNSENSEIIDGDVELTLLNNLLKEAEATNDKVCSEAIVPRLKEDSTFADAFSYDLQPGKLPADVVTVQTEELDSSDDEDIRNFLERKYSQYGCDINKNLKNQRSQQHDVVVDREVRIALSSAGQISTSISECNIKNTEKCGQRLAPVSRSFLTPVTPQMTQNVPKVTQEITAYVDPVFRLRMINPLVSSALLVERMSGRKAVAMAELALHTQRGDLSKDWVVAGALVHKSPVRMTKKDQPYSVWRISDLRGEIQMTSVFLFKSAHKDLWKTAQGMCVAILNATIFEKRAESGDVACLSIDTAQKVMILGQSKDMGVCKSRKNNGDKCTGIVNLSECDYCVYHMKQEYSKMSKRSDLQSATAGRGINALRNKILGKSEVFYGGQSFTAIPGKKSSKLIAKDMGRMSSLSEYAVSPFAGSINHTSQIEKKRESIPYAVRDGPVSKVAGNVDVTAKQRRKDLERLEILHTAGLNAVSYRVESGVASTPAANDSVCVGASPSSVSGCLNKFPTPMKFSERAFSYTANTPKLTRDNFCIEVNIGRCRGQIAKQKAAQVVGQSPIQKSNPNSVRGSQEGKRRAIDELNAKYTDVKRQKMEEQQKDEHKSRIQRIIDATSTHSDLINSREQHDRDQYFYKMEKKEALEEKLLKTYKMPCKAVICKQCKYTAFSAAERCKAERHSLKVVDAEKRFFQCKDCGNRTATVFKLPKVSCKNCKSSRWERTAMIRERKVCDGSMGLSLRGDEETFIGSSMNSSNLNLLVPED